MPASAREPRTTAQERKAAVIADRIAQFAEMKRAAEGRADMAGSMRLLDEGVAFAGTVDLMGAFLDEVAEPIRATLRTDPPVLVRRDPSLLEFVQVQAEQGTATTEAYPDGSGLVRVTDAMMSLPFYMARLVAMCLKPGRGVGLRTLWKLGTRSRADWSDAAETAVMSALLRYHVQHQRLFGLAGKVGVDLRSRAEDFAVVLGAAAATFLLSHEAAHFVLGHETDRKQVGERAEAMELEADRVGFELACRAMRSTTGMDSRQLVGIGANLVFFGIGLIEQSLYVRQPRTHPGATHRWQRIEAAFPGTASDAHRRVLVAIDLAATRAADVTRPIAPEAWSRAWRHRSVAPFHAADYLRSIEQYDTLQTHPTDELIGVLTRLGGAAAELGAPLARADHDPTAVFDAWSLPAKTQRALLDTSRPLTFFGLYAALQKVPVLRHATGPVGGSLLALVAACVVQPLLSGTLGGAGDTAERHW